MHWVKWRRFIVLFKSCYSKKKCRPVWARGRCRISPPCFLAECCKRQLNQVSFVVLYCRLSAFSDLYWVCLSVFSCTVLSVSVKWLAVKTASEMTYTVSSGALNSTPSIYLRKCPYDQWLSKAYLSAITVTNIYQRFYLQDGGKNRLAQIWNKITSLSLFVYPSIFSSCYIILHI